ncbi:MAG: hypothetical protein AAF690_16220 [Acidobacteriota bacterium]
MTMRLFGLAALTFFLLAPTAGAQENPAMPDFNTAASDAQAIALADSVMAAMGGREAWDNTRFIAWNFFGRRTHVWDKWTGNLRFEPQAGKVILMNINSKEGKVFVDGKEVADAEALAKDLDGGYKAWINDSYWLTMPYKLKDSGVTLKYVGKGELDDGRAGQIVQLTFEGVGVTPQNKYHVYVADDTGLVEQWAFFPTADAPAPQFKTPWAKWTKHGDIMLSGDRGQFQLEDIHVYDDLPASVFEDPAPVDYAALSPR